MRQGEPPCLNGLITEVLEIMQDNEIKCRIVNRMWRDNIVMGSQYADVESVARWAVPTSEEGRAKELLAGEMADNPDAPVVKTGADMVALKQNRDAVADYLRQFCENESGLPWDLR